MNFEIVIFSSTVLALVTSGGFVLFESALGFCRKSRLEKENNKKYKAVLKVLENPQKISIACRLCANILRVFAILSSLIASTLVYIEIINEAHTYNAVSGINWSFPIIFIVLFTFIWGIIITLQGDVFLKRLSRTKPEKIASMLLPVMNILSTSMIPIASAAMKISSFIDLKFKPEIDNNGITEEELRHVLLEGEKSGIVESKERTMVEGVFYLGDRPVGAFMTHRSEIELLDINTPYEEIRAKAIEHRTQQCFPVVNKSPDEIAGAVYLEDIILDYAQPIPQGLRAIMKKAQFVPETMSALKAFESFRQGQSKFLFVMDEYGGLSGIISITALVEEIVGELSIPAASEKPIIRQEDGSYLADGTLNIDDAAKALSLASLGESTTKTAGDYHTLAGFILHLAGELPYVGDSFDYKGYRFKVVDKDGNRIDKVLISKIKEL